jgi:hypothetical protein
MWRISAPPSTWPSRAARLAGHPPLGIPHRPGGAALALVCALAAAAACGDDSDDDAGGASATDSQATSESATGTATTTGSSTAGPTATDTGATATSATDTSATATDSDADTDDPVTACEAAAAAALGTCAVEVSQTLLGCYANDDTACADDDPDVAAALAALESSVGASCSDGEFKGLSVADLVGRLGNACVSESNSLAWRTYGGPQGAVWAELEPADKACLTAAHQAAIDLWAGSFAEIASCLAGGACDGAALAATRAAGQGAATAAIGEACTGLSGLIAVDTGIYVARGDRQVDCMAAAAYSDPSAAALTCGPTYAQFDAPRGEWTQIVVDGDTWGTVCGDGSPYAFWVRLAPEGAPLDRIVIALEGGGVCLFEDDCSQRLASNPGLFTAMDGLPLGDGLVSDDPAVSPFADWTKVYVPYCNQDVFAGGGVTEVLGALELPRFGAVNLRAAVQMTRDVLWKLQDEAGGPGFRPDQMLALFGGFSAGAYGTLYNYHWMLDDLQWPRTAAFPDAGMALDNGGLLGVRQLGVTKIPVWGARKNLPPYCFAGPCAVGPNLYRAISPRLLQVPEQQMLVVSNPRDTIQQGDAFFEDEPTWINAVRRDYCETKDLPGIQYYFTNTSSEPVHVVTIRPELWTAAVDGEVMRDWFWRAVTDPASLVDRVQEAAFVTDVPGVDPYPCPVTP